MKKLINKLTFVIAFAFLAVSCGDYFDFELPESNSQLDLNLPTAGFSFQQDPIEWRQYQFANSSTESLFFEWDFGTGETSEEENPSYFFEGGEGTYTVTLTSRDLNGEFATISQEVEVVQPPEPSAITPTIFEGGFEDGMLEGASGDGRDSWRNDAGGVIQITSSPVFSGSQAAKLPSDGDRVGMQMIEVTPNADYEMTFYYTMKEDPGTLTVAILSEMITDLSQVAETTIASVAVTDNTDPNTYVETVMKFNPGANSQVAIFFHNEGSECRLDDLSIEPE